MKQRNVAKKQHDQTAEPVCAASSVREAAADERPEPQPTAAAKAVPVVLRGLGEELTSDIGRDAPVDPVVAANSAFQRIEGHRRLFRRDWLPFLDGVYHLSLQAWESAGRRTRLNRKPDWDHDRVQVEFRKAIRGLPWEHYFESRRTLLSVLRKIGGDREAFLEWHDDDKRADKRERAGHPETLWRMFEKEVLRPAPAGRQEQRDDAADARADDEPVAEKAAARTDAERMADLVVRNEKWHDIALNWHDFGTMLLDSMNDGRSTLEAHLREKLDDLLGEDYSR
jgi:hypothetical protein